MGICVPLPKLLLLLSWPFVGVLGHGRLLEPPSRSSMWRFGYNTPRNYDDNQLFCGGVGVQYSHKVDGKCGVCGDPWFGPRENEAGGKFATGTIVRKYDIGQVINVTVELTANHKGSFEFRLCQKDDPFERATWDCLNKHVLEVAMTKETTYPIKKGFQKKFSIKLSLPKDVKCSACLLQWKYTAGNSWGINEDGTGCIGCGNQEQFYGCADVAIGHDDVVLGKAPDNPFKGHGSGSGNKWTYVVNSINETFGDSGCSSRWQTGSMLMYLLTIAVIIIHMQLIIL